MRGTLAVAAIVGMAGLAGCSPDPATKVDSAETSVAPSTSTAPTKPPGASLPAPDALTDVLARLTDPAVPGSDKLNLVEGSTPDTAAALDRYTAAVRDGGYLPMTFVADNLKWSDQNPSNVVATVVVATANPQHREFTFPMEFTALPPGWQLSKKTAQVLLALGNAHTSTAPTPPPTPAPGPAPSADQVPDLGPPANQTPGPEPSPLPSPPTSPSAAPTPTP